MYIISKHTGSTSHSPATNKCMGMNIHHLLNLLRTHHCAHLQKKGVFWKNEQKPKQNKKSKQKNQKPTSHTLQKNQTTQKPHSHVNVREKLRAGWQRVFTQALSQETVFSTDAVIEGAHLLIFMSSLPLFSYPSNFIQKSNRRWENTYSSSQYIQMLPLFFR